MSYQLFFLYKQAFPELEDGLTQVLVNNTEIHTIKEQVLFQRIGEVSPTIDILLSGLVRGFFLDGTGKEVTDCFEFERGTPLVSSSSWGAPSVISLEALTEVTVASISLDVLSTHLNEPSLLRLMLRFLSVSLGKHWEIKMMLANRSTKERYAWFLEKYPGLIDRVSHQYIASFLGVSPVTLSRTRHAKPPAAANNTAGQDESREGTLPCHGEFSP